jgi:hypothetical protein
MNKKIYSIGACILLSISSVIAQNVGNDKDEHGCRASAGYIYSVIKNDCIRLFEQEIQLNEVNPSGTSTSFSAVIFNEDKTKAEVFIPESKTGIILNRKGKAGHYSWKKGKLCLTQNKEKWVLKKSKTIIFSN